MSTGLYVDPDSGQNISTTRRENLAWCAGFYDGEGSSYVVRVDRKHIAHQAAVRAGIGQLHPEVLQKFADTVGFGNVNGPYGEKQSYRWGISGFERVQALMAMLWPWLGDIKRAQFMVALSRHGKDF